MYRIVRFLTLFPIFFVLVSSTLTLVALPLDRRDNRPPGTVCSAYSLNSPDDVTRQSADRVEDAVCCPPQSGLRPQQWNSGLGQFPVGHTVDTDTGEWHNRKHQTTHRHKTEYLLTADLRPAEIDGPVWKVKVVAPELFLKNDHKGKKYSSETSRGQCVWCWWRCSDLTLFSGVLFFLVCSSKEMNWTYSEFLQRSHPEDQTETETSVRVVRRNTPSAATAGVAPPKINTLLQ